MLGGLCRAPRGHRERLDTATGRGGASRRDPWDEYRLLLRMGAARLVGHGIWHADVCFPEALFTLNEAGWAIYALALEPTIRCSVVARSSGAWAASWRTKREMARRVKQELRCCQNKTLAD